MNTKNKKLTYWQFWRKNWIHRHIYTLPVFIGAIATFSSPKDPNAIPLYVAFYVVAFALLSAVVLLGAYLDWKD